MINEMLEHFGVKISIPSEFLKRRSNMVVKQFQQTSSSVTSAYECFQEGKRTDRNLGTIS